MALRLLEDAASFQAPLQCSLATLARCWPREAAVDCACDGYRRPAFVRLWWTTAWHARPCGSWPECRLRLRASAASALRRIMVVIIRSFAYRPPDRCSPFDKLTTGSSRFPPGASQPRLTRCGFQYRARTEHNALCSLACPLPVRRPGWCDELRPPAARKAASRWSAALSEGASPAARPAPLCRPHHACGPSPVRQAHRRQAQGPQHQASVIHSAPDSCHCACLPSLTFRLQALSRLKAGSCQPLQ